MLSQLRPVVASLAIFTLLLGIGYPLAMTGIAQAIFPAQANGSLVERDGRAVGSALVGQTFADPRYFHPRPSAAGTGYDGAASSGTNLGPTSAKLADRIKADADAARQATGADLVPADAVTTSGSGLDPDISPAFAALQAARVAQARNVPGVELQRLVADQTRGRTLGILGEPRVNVLALNIALDAMFPTPGATGAAPVAGTPPAAAQPQS